MPRRNYWSGRRTKPTNIIKGTYRTVSPNKYKGNLRKNFVRGTKLIIGKSKKTGNWIIQSVLTPKKYNRQR